MKLFGFEGSGKRVDVFIHSRIPSSKPITYYTACSVEFSIGRFQWLFFLIEAKKNLKFYPAEF